MFRKRKMYIIIEHTFCPVHFSVILAILEKFKQERANVLKLLCIKDAFPISLAH